ncbi:hypothetical protein [Nonomuraea sp. KM90]|uniref:hypothetical protein n=1 Tax=Nonomuraea sp. KM90 TaxID=3457428 RepID=UPI003FCE9766
MPLGQIQQGTVDADGQSASGEWVADQVLPASEGDQATGVDGSVDLDRLTSAGASRSGGGFDTDAALCDQLPQVPRGEPGRDFLDPDPGGQQLDSAGIGPQRDGHAGPVRAEPELLSTDGQVARGGDDPGELDGQIDHVGPVSRHHQLCCLGLH